MTLYRELLAKALAFSWRYKFLWPLGFLVALTGNGEYEMLLSPNDTLGGHGLALGFLRAFYMKGVLSAYWENTKDFFLAYPLTSSLVALATILLGIFVVWVITVGQGGLVWALARLQGKPQQKAAFAQSFFAGTRLFWPVFLINLVAKIIVFGPLLLIAFPLGLGYIRTGIALYDTLYIIVAFLLLVPVYTVLTFVTKFAVLYVIVEKQTWRDAFRNGWRFFLQNWLVSVEIWAIVLVLSVLILFAVSFVITMAGLPYSNIGLAVSFVVMTLVGIYVILFKYLMWVLLFFRLREGKLQSKLLRVTEPLMQRLGATPPAVPPSTKAK